MYHINGCLTHRAYDPRDHTALPTLDTSQKLESADLRHFSMGRHSQGSTGSCVAQAICKALEIKRVQKYGADAHEDLSALFVYYMARLLISTGHTQVDSGCYIAHACKVLHTYGVCPERFWPFSVSKLHDMPPLKAVRNAYVHKINSYRRIKQEGWDRVRAVRASLVSGHPVVYGTPIGSEWTRYNKRSKPLGLAAKPTGRHATVLVGFDERGFIGENSWGRQWGSDGFYTVKPEVIASRDSRDFWTIQGHWE